MNDRNPDYVALAEQIARAAHTHQTDKAGKPYIDHPAAVARMVAGHGETTEAVAWLHDVVEDTTVTLDDLASQFPAEVVAAVDAITHCPGEPRTLAGYYGRVRSNPTARVVKLADIRHNSDPARLAELEPETRARLEEKYAKALDALS